MMGLYLMQGGEDAPVFITATAADGGLMAKKHVRVPRVVIQTNPPRRGLQWLVLLVVLLLVAWLAYRYGRSQVPPAGVQRASSPQTQQRIEALEQERNSLKQQITALQREARQRGDALDQAGKRIRTLEQARTSPEADAQPPAAAPAPAAPARNDNRLRLQDVRLVRGDEANRFAYSFAVVHNGDPADQVVGTIWIAVNGQLHGKPTRLSLEKVSANSRPFVKMDFKERQEIKGELLLPEAFTAKNISIEAKPYSNKFKQSAQKIEWSPGD